VELQHAGDSVVLTVADRGRGFDADASASHAGLGLVSMKERARLLNGSLKISSAPGKGATLEVSIPIAVAGAVHSA
jgi:signal transduction histidine kinase